jgi:ketosteroid isomerase-like protein
MKKILLLVLIISALSGCTQKEVSPTIFGKSSLEAFLPRWEEAQKRFINGDPALWKQNSSQGDDATVLGAFGGYVEKGWNAVGSRYDWASSQYKDNGTKLKIEYLNIGSTGDLGYTVSIERQEGVLLMNQQEPGQQALRVTQIFRKENGAWKLVHRHADPLLEKKESSPISHSENQ